MAKHNISKVSVEELSAKQAKAEHGRLHAELVEHDKRYYQQDTPTISDAEYDALRKRYGDIEQRFPNLRTLESLTLKVGVAPTGRKIHFETVDAMRVHNGKITEHWGVANLFSLMQQLGAWPPAAQA